MSTALRPPRSLGAIAAAAAVLLAACGGAPGERAAAPTASAAPSVAFRANPSQPVPSTSIAMAMPPASASPTPLAEDVAALRREVAELHREVRELRRAPDRPFATDGTAAPDPRHDAVARAEADRMERLRAAASEAAFRSEDYDARWSAGTAAAVRAAFSTQDGRGGDAVRNVECRSLTCRIEIGADASAEVERRLPAWIGRLGATLPNLTATRVDQGDGREATVLYLSR